MNLTINQQGEVFVSDSGAHEEFLFFEDPSGAKRMRSALSSIEEIDRRKAVFLELIKIARFYNTKCGRYKAYLVSEQYEIEISKWLDLAEVKISLTKKIINIISESLGCSYCGHFLTLPFSWGYGSAYPTIDSSFGVDTLELSGDDKTVYGLPNGIINPRPGILGIIDYAHFYIVKFGDVSPYQDTFSFIEAIVKTIDQDKVATLNYASEHLLAREIYKKMEERFLELLRRFTDYEYVDRIVLPILRKKKSDKVGVDDLLKL